MRYRSLSFFYSTGLLAILLCLCAAPALAQLGGRREISPVQSNTRYPVKTQPQVIQSGISETASPKNQPNRSTPADACQSNTDRGNTHSNSPYRANVAGYPQYPGPNAPLPTPGTYYVNPYGYYNSPYAPHPGGAHNGGYNNGGHNNVVNPVYRGSNGTEQRR